MKMLVARRNGKTRRMMAPFTGGCGCGAFGGTAAGSGLPGVAIATRSRDYRGVRGDGKGVGGGETETTA